MLTAGVFGTVLGDIVSHLMGKGPASLALGALFAATLLTFRHRAARLIPLYWLIVATARTAGTAMGDWLADTKALHLGLPLSTMLTCVSFVAVLTAWRSAPAADRLA